MALALQTQYPEYARRKRTAFKSLVSKGLVTYIPHVYHAAVRQLGLL